jgi:hypothetical protein
MGAFWSRVSERDNAALLAQQAATAWSTPELMLVFADLATFAAYAVTRCSSSIFCCGGGTSFSWVWFLLLVYLIIGRGSHVLDAFGDWEPWPAGRWR